MLWEQHEQAHLEDAETETNTTEMVNRPSPHAGKDERLSLVQHSPALPLYSHSNSEGLRSPSRSPLDAARLSAPRKDTDSFRSAHNRNHNHDHYQHHGETTRSSLHWGWVLLAWQGLSLALTGTGTFSQLLSER